MPPAPAFETQQLAAVAWRAVEAQHRVATLRLVDHRLADQAILEDIIEATKPAVPEPARGKHWLLQTPFRYRPAPPGSRFRAPHDPGVFYAAFEQRTACAEAGYWRWRFVTDSEGLRGLPGKPMTLFAAQVHARAVDLRMPPHVERRAAWTDPKAYAATQAFAREARRHDVEAIVYESVRDPEHGGAVAVLTPAPLDGPVGAPQNWFLTIADDRAIWQREFGEAYEFTYRRAA